MLKPPAIRFGRPLATFFALLCTSIGLVGIPVVLATGDGGDDPLGNLPSAHSGAFEGGTTGTHDDAHEEAIPEPLLAGGEIPTGGAASPLFGAQPFTQKMMRFEEFGTGPMQNSHSPGEALPMPPVAEAVPNGTLLESFLRQAMFPEPTRMCNDLFENPWKQRIEEFLGRPLDTAPAEGRPAGEMWAHQRWDEFPPQVCFTTAQSGARPNLGGLDSRQLHGYTLGEFGPGGLYHQTVNGIEYAGTTTGMPVKFHPNMPEQHPLALWTFDGTLPPKLLMARYGESILMRHYNALPISPSANMGFGLHTISTHEHNGHNPAESDGYTNAFFFPGQYYDYRWPMILAGHDTINSDATDPRAGMPDGNGGIINIPGDWRETMSTHWFHDHMLDFTAQNVYKGNAAMMNYYSSLDRGNEGLDDGVNLRLPSGTARDWGNRDYDVNLVIADKAWMSDGQLWFNIFNVDGFLGDQLLTNWQFKPYLDVRARRYRFRILNGSVSRYLKLVLVDQNGARVPFHMVCNDGNIMEHTVAFDGTLGTEIGELPTLAIAERYDIIVDFSNFQPGDKLHFVNVLEHRDGKGPEEAIPLEDVLSGDYNPVVDAGLWTDGDPCVGKFLEFRVHAYDGVDLSMNPADFESGKQTLIPLNRPTQEELDSAIRREFVFGRSQGTDSAPWTIKTDGGVGFTMDPRRLSASPSLQENAQGLGKVEIWRLESGGGWSHPVHVHFEEGQILSRGGNPPPEWEKWARKDVYRIGRMDDSTQEVVFAIRFREFAGTYMEHCHNTQHEDHAMLLRWDIERPGQVTMLPTPLPTWEGVEYVDSLALPTFRSGAGTAMADGPGIFSLQITPGTAGNPNAILCNGLTDGDRTAFLFGFDPGPLDVAIGPCPAGLTLGLLDPNFLGLAEASGSTSSFSVDVPAEFASMTVHMQAINLENCRVTNVFTHTFE